jgi:hypothetical protein
MNNRPLTHFFAGILAILATSVFFIIGVLTADSSQSILSVIFAGMFIAGGLFIGYKVYRTAVNRGIIPFMTYVNASPDLDNLEPSPDSNHKKYDISQFISAFQKKENLFPQGTRLRVWGNYTFPGFNSYHEIISVQSPDQNLLEISFMDQKTLKIWNPQYILEGKSYFKIVDCAKIEWTYSEASGNKPVSAVFELQKNHIEVATQPTIPVSRDSFQPGEPAVVLL